MKLFISPHNDDETLFGAFTILRERPAVMIVTDSKRQQAKGIFSIERKRETMASLAILGASEVHFLGIPDECLDEQNFIRSLAQFFQNRKHHAPDEHIFAPAFEENGNVDHNLVANSLDKALKELHLDLPVTRYLTYTTNGKSQSKNRVQFEADWPMRKMQALWCYQSQILEPSTRDHFLRDQYEYYA